jgi:hypothetical protein
VIGTEMTNFIEVVLAKMGPPLHNKLSQEDLDELEQTLTLSVSHLESSDPSAVTATLTPAFSLAHAYLQASLTYLQSIKAKNV